ncbi:DNA excision repair protein ERCC-8 [Trichinella pseudospiralis]|uniref:DNA excision repair protein ERCC-8 n=1 Tax=Trichinella pseudospiralis TaxID=6337 RepID=A0A0V0XZ22_TRIPS|nr:DNA excision repair protein ERCC-8 [Trichinella pseudospiralis]
MLREYRNLRESGMMGEANTVLQQIEMQHLLKMRTTNLLSIDRLTSRMEMDSSEQFFLFAEVSGLVRIGQMRAGEKNMSVIAEWVPRCVMPRYKTTCLRWHPWDHSLFTSVGTDGRLNAWSAATMVPIQTTELGYSLRYHSICNNPSAEPLIAAAYNERFGVPIVDLRDNMPCFRLGNRDVGVASFVEWSPREKNCVLSMCPTGIYVWDIRSNMVWICLLSLLLSLLYSCFLLLLLLQQIPVKKLVPPDDRSNLRAMKVSSDGQHLFTLQGSNRFGLWHLPLMIFIQSTPSQERLGLFDKKVQFDMFSPVQCDENYAFVPVQDFVHLMCLRTGNVPVHLHGPINGTDQCIYRRISQQLIICGIDSRPCLCTIPNDLQDLRENPLPEPAPVEDEF